MSNAIDKRINDLKTNLDNSMSELDKLLQQKNRVEAEIKQESIREKDRERKARTRRLIQLGALCEKFFSCEGIMPQDFEKFLSEFSKNDTFKKPVYISNFPKKIVKKYYVYALIDPQNKKSIYIGQTLDIKRRYKEHLRCGKGEITNDFIEPIKQNNSEPILLILDEVEEREVDAKALKYVWVKIFNERGYNVTNTLADHRSAANLFIWHIPKYEARKNILFDFEGGNIDE